MDEQPSRDRASAFGCLVAGGALLAATGGTCAAIGAGGGSLLFLAVGLLMMAFGFFRYHDR